GRITSMAPPSHCARPQPEVTMIVCPSGWVCHAVRAPGSKVTCAAAVRAGVAGWNKGSIRTAPVNQSAGPLVDACDSARWILMGPFSPGEEGHVDDEAVAKVRALLHAPGPI